VSRVLVAHQPNYLPYLGFFHKAARADVVVLQDDLKYIKNDYGNRNRVQAEESWRWLSIPVRANNQSTFDTVVAADRSWPRDHANILRSKYLRADHRDRLAPYVEAMPALASEPLSVISIALIRSLFEEYAIEAPIVIQSELDAGPFDNPNDRLIALCRRFDCDTYVSGTGGRAYIEDERWAAAGIALEWSDYEPVEYGRGAAPWIPNLSALDALAHAADPAALIR
jgi:WbqC-like protein family